MDCADCSFGVPLKPLAQESSTAKSTVDKVADVVLIPIKMEGKGASNAVKALKHLFGIGGGGGSVETTYQVTDPKIPSGSSLDTITDGNFVLPLPFVYFFRVVPLTADGQIAGGPSNTVELRWHGEDNPNPITIYNCPPGSQNAP